MGEERSSPADWDYSVPLCKGCRYELWRIQGELVLRWDSDDYPGKCWRCKADTTVIRCDAPMLGCAFCKSCGTLFTNVAGATLLCTCDRATTACETFYVSRIEAMP